MDTTHSFLTLWAYRLFLVGLFLLPIGIFMSAAYPLLPLKVVIASFMLIGSAVLGLASALKSGWFEIPTHPLMLAAWGIPIASVLTLFVTPSLWMSLFGDSLDLDTVFFAFLLALATTVPVYLFRSRADTARAFFTLLIASWVVAVFHLIRLLFGADTFSFEVFTSPLFSLIGKWNDLAIYFGLVAVLGLMALEALPLERMHQYIIAATVAIALFFAAVINFTPVWICLGIVSLGIVLSRAFVRGSQRVSVGGTIVLVVSLIAIIFASSAGTILGTYFGTNQIEARPSLGSTIDVATETLSSSPFLGSGANTFILAWDSYRPADLNSSIFWNADFTSGYGFVPTVLVTQGIIGVLVWILFLGLFVYYGVRSLLLSSVSDQHAYHLKLSTYVAAAYLLVMTVIYLPSPVLIVIGFVMVGMFIALSYGEGVGSTFKFSFSERPRIGFLAVLVSVLLAVGLVVSLYSSTAVYAANVYFEKAAISAQRDGDLDGAITHLDSSLALYQSDKFYRLKVLAHLTKLNAVVSNASAAPTADEQKVFQDTLGFAVESGLAATRVNPENYRNWQALGNAYQSVVPLQVDGAYEAAVNAFVRAGELNPITPSIPITRAQLEIARGDAKAARPFVDAALTLKGDYIPALLLMAQLDLNDGDLDKAIEKAEAASVFEPSNPVIRFQVGLLKYEAKDYAGARDALEAAVTLAPDYANAHFYLGRVYLELKEGDKARSEFEAILKYNPDNEEVTSVITALDQGRDPFAPAPPTEEEGN